MTDKKKKRVGVLALLLLFLLLGGSFFIYTQERPELFIPKDEIITRGEFAAILVRNIPLDTADAKRDTASFPDTRGHWSEKYIEALINAGIIDPADYPDGFKPDEPITRAEIIKMLVRISGRDEEAKNTKGHSGYDDDKDIRNGDKGYVIIGREDNIIGDEDGGKLKPNKSITKGEAEKMIDKTKPLPIPISEIPKPTPEPTTPVPVEPTPMPVEPTPTLGKPTPIPKPGRDSDDHGNATRIADSAYDANSGCVIFTTPHFSQYGIGYTAPTADFTDISSHWAKESIDYVVGRGLLSGTSDTAFSPDFTTTRGILVTTLGRLAGVDTKAYAENRFTDVNADSAYRPYIEWAYSKGIMQGIGGSQFAPDREITREEIAVIFVNYAKETGYTLPITREAITYADASSIGSAYKDAVKAMQQAGIMMGGSDNTFNPKGNVTRGEVSSLLNRYIKLTINTDTAQGWALNDAGQYLYYKDGLMISGKWIEIDGKWYYFYTDGSLARSTQIDGYEIDENGVRKTK